MIKNVLVVDDDPNVVEIITESLRNNGYNTESAYDGVTALEVYEKYQPDLVVLDVGLPRKDGFEVCNEIRSKDVNNDVPVILISGNSIPDTMLHGFNSGAQDYIKKPFSVKEVLAKIDNFLMQANGRKNLREQNEILEDELEKGQKDYKRINRELKKKVLDFETLFSLSKDLNRLRDPEELTHVFFLTVIGQLAIDSVALFYAEKNTDPYLSYVGGKGLRNNVLQTIRLTRKDGLSKHLLSKQDVVNLKDGELPEDAARESIFLRDLGFACCYPLIVNSCLTGIIFLGEKINKLPYNLEDLAMLRSICSSAATGLENSRLYSELQDTYLSTIKVLVSTIEAKDSYTKGHTERVARYARLIAEEMGMDREQRDTVSFGAALHDIGKLGVYETILNKPGELTDNEWEVVRSHPEVGANIIKNMKFLETACDLVRHHHERLDGNGYPDGLKGDEISTGARIVAVADSFDAMTSNRPYRKALEYREALSALLGQGEKFDLKIVKNLVKLVEKGVIKQ
ncbi:MAG: response regulator [Bacteroidales bacterium]|nr:response regulator [Candidatus Latescibacterota bacterium]